MSEHPHPRDLITEEQQLLIDETANQIVAKLKAAMSKSDLKFFAKQEDGIEFTMAEIQLGRYIRNSQKLWLLEHPITKIWVEAKAKFPPKGEDFVDSHPCHPDNFSGLCIQKFLESLK